MALKSAPASNSDRIQPVHPAAAAAAAAVDYSRTMASKKATPSGVAFLVASQQEITEFTYHDTF